MGNTASGASLRRAAPEAYREIVAHRAGASGFAAGQGISSRGALWPVFSDVAAAELAAVYQAGRAAAAELRTHPRRTSLTRTVAAGEEAAEALCGSMFRLCHQICSEQLRRSPGAELEDLNARAQVAVLEAAEKFSPKQHSSFSAWAAGSVRRSVAKEAAVGEVSMPASWRRVARAAWAVTNEARDQGARLEGDQLAERVRESLEKRLEEHLMAADDRPDDIGEAVRQSLTKQGVFGALRKVGTLMDAVQAHHSFDQKMGPEESTTLGDRIVGSGLAGTTDTARTLAMSDEHGEAADAANLEHTMFGVDSTLGRAARVYLKLEGDGTLSTYRQVAEEHGVDPLELRAYVRRARVRAHAPHAQYAHLAPSVTSQISETGPSRFGDMLAAGR